jgi:hypothetical protein
MITVYSLASGVGTLAYGTQRWACQTQKSVSNKCERIDVLKMSRGKIENKINQLDFKCIILFPKEYKQNRNNNKKKKKKKKLGLRCPTPIVTLKIFDFGL